MFQTNGIKYNPQYPSAVPLKLLNHMLHLLFENVRRGKQINK